MVRNIKLSGDDALQFANRLFHPTLDEINHTRELIKRNNEGLTIRKTTNGFAGTVEGFDLSFL